MSLTRNFLRIVFSSVALWSTVAAHADVTDTPTVRQFSVPGTQWKVAIPKDNWVIAKEQRRPGDTTVYYVLENEKQGQYFSVFIDKTNNCQNGPTCLTAALKNPAYKNAKDARQFEVGPFTVTQFFIDEFSGYQVKQTNLLAEAYLDGYWIDIHISAVGKERPAPEPLIELLKSVTIN